jgi:hypothetical protein
MSRWYTKRCPGCETKRILVDLVESRPHGRGPIDVIQRGAAVGMAAILHADAELCPDCESVVEEYAELLGMHDCSDPLHAAKKH